MKIDNIILIGMPGTGKSTVGAILADRANIPFIDLDLLIEKNENKTITKIFEEFGEDVFRDIETKTLKELKGKFILATGGGIVEKDINKEILQSLGVVVYINTPIDTIYERIKNDKTRPLLQGDNPKEKLLKLFFKRKEKYENFAQIIIDNELEPNKTADKIYEKTIGKNENK